MSPLYAYVCGCGSAAEKIRTFAHRLDPVKCSRCGAEMEYRISAHHAQADGIYSYAPNIGSADDFERKKADADARADRTGTYKP